MKYIQSVCTVFFVTVSLLSVRSSQTLLLPSLKLIDAQINDVWLTHWSLQSVSFVAVTKTLSPDMSGVSFPVPFVHSHGSECVCPETKNDAMAIRRIRSACIKQVHQVSHASSGEQCCQLFGLSKEQWSVILHITGTCTYTQGKFNLLLHLTLVSSVSLIRKSMVNLLRKNITNIRKSILFFELTWVQIT